MSVKLLTEHHLEFLSLKGGCVGSSESTLVKMPHCWNHVLWLICRNHLRKKVNSETNNISLTCRYLSHILQIRKFSRELYFRE